MNDPVLSRPSPGQVVVHVPPPFSRRNTLVMVADELARAAREMDVRSVALFASTRDVRLENGESVFLDYRSASPRENFTKPQLYLDLFAARAGLPRSYVQRLFRVATSAAKDLEPTLVLLYEGFYALPSLPLWRRVLPTSSLVLYAHNGFSRSYGRAEIRRCLRDADGVAVVSTTLRDSLLERLPRPPCPVEVIHNGVDTDLFTAPARSTHRDGDVFTILFVGIVVPHKGPDRLLRAVAQARADTACSLRLQVVGSSAYDASDALTEYERSLRRTASELGVDVLFTPFVPHDQLPAMYHGADLLCMPSLNEDPYGLVILEAMACGLPVIASGRGGTREAGGEHAIYVDPDDTEAFAGAIADLANDPAKAAERGAASRRWAELHSWSDTMQRLLAMAR